MRITFLLPYAGLAGGIRVVAIYAQRLHRRGHRVCIVSTPDCPPNRRERMKRQLLRWSWRLRGLAEPSHLAALPVEHHVLDAARRITDADVPDADVVVATWWETAEWVAALSAAKGAKAYFIQHYENHPGQPIERVQATWQLPLHKIAVARWLVDLARKEYGDTNVSLVPNSVDLDLFTAPRRGKQSAPTVGVMYAATYFKGCDISLKAYELAAQSIDDLHLVAFGAGRPTKQLPLPPGALFTCRPPQPVIRELYASCDAWLCASRSEGFGLPMLEAMACRTPVIATPAGAAPQLLSGGGGILVKPQDAPDMARAIEGICRLSDAQWRAMSDDAYATASRYSWDDATELFEQALVAAIERSRRGELTPTVEPMRATA